MREWRRPGDGGRGDIAGGTTRAGNWREMAKPIEVTAISLLEIDIIWGRWHFLAATAA